MVFRLTLQYNVDEALFSFTLENAIDMFINDYSLSHCMWPRVQPYDVAKLKSRSGQGRAIWYHPGGEEGSSLDGPWGLLTGRGFLQELDQWFPEATHGNPLTQLFRLSALARYVAGVLGQERTFYCWTMGGHSLIHFPSLSHPQGPCEGWGGNGNTAGWDFDPEEATAGPAEMSPWNVLDSPVGIWRAFP